MSDERPSPATLAYEPPDPRRRLARQLARVALIVSAIAFLIAGVSLYSRFSPIVRIHLEQYRTQQAVLDLNEHGTIFDSPVAPIMAGVTDSNAIDKAAARWATAFGLFPPSRWGGGSNGPTSLVYVGPLQNASGVDRIICIAITAPYQADRHTSTWVSACVIAVRPRVSIFPFARSKTAHWSGSTPLFLRTNLLHLAPPAVDPSNPKRLLIDAKDGNEDRSFELLLDANDRAQCFDLLTSHAATLPSD